MTDHHQTQDPKPTKAGSSGSGYSSGPKYPNPPEMTGYSSGTKYPNPPELTNPDPITLREQWKFATKQYSRWYSRAWGMAILAGLAFFAFGWILKGSEPFPTNSENHKKNENKRSPEEAKQG